VAGLTDHIVPWQAAYRTTQMLGGRPEFVLSSSGHIQSIVNPPGNPKAAYVSGGRTAQDPQRWLRGASEAKGTWWEHWTRWVGGQSGRQVPAPERLGSRKHRPLEPAPGRYVMQK
jgi:polyhydroxyalkanoate synthase